MPKVVTHGDNADDRAARRALRLLPVRTRAMRIAFDVSPLSHPRTGIGNYILGSLGGLVEAAGEEHEIVAFAPTSLRGRRAIPEALAGIPVEQRLRVLPFSHRVPDGVEPARAASDRALSGTDRRAPLLRLDVSAAGRRCAGDDDPRPRAAALPGVGHAAHAGDARREVRRTPRRTCDVDLHQLGVHRGRRRRAPRRAARARPRRPARARAGVLTGGRRADLGGPYVLGVGTLEPRKNLGRLVEAWRLLPGDLVLALAGGEGWGAQPRARRSADPAARVRRATTSCPASTAAPRSSSTRRCSRASGSRSIEAMACGTPVVASAHPSLDEACGDAAVRADPDGSGRDRRRRSARRCAAARSSSRKGSRMRRGSRGARSARPFSAATRRRVRVGFDTSPLVQTQAGTARHVRGLLRALAARAGARDRAALLRRAGPGVDGPPRRALVPARHRAGLGALRRPPLHDLSRAVPLAGPGRPDRPRSRRAPASRRRFGPGTGSRRAPRSTASAPRPPSSPSPSSRRREVIELLGVPPERVRVVPNGIEPLFSPCRRRGRGRLRARRRDARAAQEPRARRRGGAARPVSSCGSSVRAAGVASTSPAGSAGSRTRSSPGSTAAPAASSTRRSTRASGCRCSRRWRAARRS